MSNFILAVLVTLFICAFYYNYRDYQHYKKYKNHKISQERQALLGAGILYIIVCVCVVIYLGIWSIIT